MTEHNCDYCSETFSRYMSWYAHFHFEHYGEWLEENKEALSNE